MPEDDKYKILNARIERVEQELKEIKYNKELYDNTKLSELEKKLVDRTSIAGLFMNKVVEDWFKDTSLTPLGLKIEKLEDLVGAYRNYQNNCSYTDNIQQVLREFMNTIKRFIHLEKTGAYDNEEWNETLDGFKLEISKLEEKLDQKDDDLQWQEHDEACYQFCSGQIDEMIKDGEKPSEPKIPPWIWNQEYECEFKEKEPTEAGSARQTVEITDMVGCPQCGNKDKTEIDMNGNSDVIWFRCRKCMKETTFYYYNVNEYLGKKEDVDEP